MQHWSARVLVAACCILLATCSSSPRSSETSTNEPASGSTGPPEASPSSKGGFSQEAAFDAWLRSVLASSGFDVVENPREATLVGRSDDFLFNIWVRPPRWTFDGLPRFDEIAGVEVYGFGRTEYLVWWAQGEIVSIASSSKDYEGLPTGRDLEKLISVSIETPLPAS
jgi:hypothetical protein